MNYTIINNIPSWTKLNKFGRSKFFKSSYIWVAVVPLAAKILSSIESPLSMEILNANIKINISLPFSWQMFYFSSLFIGIGSAIYSIFCPEIIKNYDKFSDFTDEGKGGKQIIENIMRIVSVNKYLPIGESVKEPELIEFMRLFTDKKEYTLSNVTKISYEEMLNSLIKDSNVQNSFWWVRNAGDCSHLLMRLFCSISYFFGVTLLFIVFLQNTQYVINQML